MRPHEVASPAANAARGDEDGDGVKNAIGDIEVQFALLADRYRQRVRGRAAEIDEHLQPSGYRALKVLVDFGPTGASAIADRLGTDRSVVSRQLRQLADLGLIVKDRDATDGRAVVVRATPEAVARMEAMNRSGRDRFRSRLGAWSQRDLAEFGRLLAKLGDG